MPVFKTGATLVSHLTVWKNVPVREHPVKRLVVPPRRSVFENAYDCGDHPVQQPVITAVGV
ncbi:MAG: hypothetical protein SGJ27_17630 [Candidatus Melainabacteria bacterium]|nr:hypothetical protein [Candidatus Melainabacteria bacterium]